MRILIVLISLVFPFVGVGQTIDWYELVIIPELNGADFLVVEIDSVGKKCLNKNEFRYCTESEEAHDYKVIELQERQIETLKDAAFHWKLVSVDSLETDENSDKTKYRYLIDYDYDLIGIDKGRSSVIYLKLDFLLIDRKTGKILGRSMQYDIKSPFKSMNLLMDELFEMNTLK